MEVPAFAYAFAGLSGAALGTGWDRLHAAAGTLAYAGTGHLQPWWVPVEFAIAGVAIVLGVRTLGDPSPGPRSPRRAAGEIVWFTVLYATTAVLFRKPELITLILAVCLLARASAFRAVGRANLAPALALVIGGPLTESLIAATGLFSYARAGMFGLPVWLPVLYMNGVLLIVRGTEALLWVSRPRRTVE